MSVDPASGVSSASSSAVAYKPRPVAPSDATATSGATSAANSAGPGASVPLSGDSITSSGPSTLAPGSRGSSVKALQTLVGAKADGIYGPQTTAAVAKYQAANGLRPDGIAGPQTWNALTGGEKTLGPGSRGASVANVQKLVGAKPDGIYGPQTQAAVANYQKQHGLTSDGIVGSKTWQGLASGAPAFSNVASPAQSAKPVAGTSTTTPPKSNVGPSQNPVAKSAPSSGPNPNATAPSTANATPATTPKITSSTTPNATNPATPNATASNAKANGGQNNALVANGSEYLDKLGAYFTNPINDGKLALSTGAKFARRDFDALSNAAKANTQFADKVRSVVNDFDKKPASEINTAIRGLVDEVQGGKQTFKAPSALGNVAQNLEDANKVPTAVESLGSKAASAVNSATASAQNALENAPGPLRGLGRWASQKLGSAVESVKANVADAYQSSSLKQLPDAVKSQADNTASALEGAAAKQTAQASSPLLKTLKAFGTTPDDLTAAGKIPVIGNVPILSLATTAYSTVNDAKKVGTADSVAANVGSMFAGQIGGRAVQNALVNGLGNAAQTTVGEAATSVGAEAATGVAAEAATGIGAEAAGSTIAGLAGEAALAGGAEVAGDALVGAAVASGPAGWAILAGVGAGIAIGVGVKDIVESKADQDIINGAFSGNLDQVGKGFGEAGQDVVDLGKGAVNLGESAISGAAHLGSDAIDEGKKALNSIGSFFGL